MAKGSSTRRPPVRRRPGSTGSSRGRGAAAAAAPGPTWIGGARLRTLPLAVAPVLLGTGAVWSQRIDGRYWLAFLALAVSLLLQIGVNFANDYSDGVRGTDAHRVGPPRLTASGRVRPRAVLTVALVCFALAAVAGLAIVLVTRQWWLLAVGAAAIAAAWFYTGGRRPYGYAGLGELVVFLFFGLAATAGTAYVITGTVNDVAWFCAVGIGCIASAVLVVNNLRDIDQDRAAGKRTLSVRIGSRASRVLYGVLMLLPFGIAAWLALVYPEAWLTLLVLLVALPAVIITATARTARELVLALSLSGITALLYGVVLSFGLSF